MDSLSGNLFEGKKCSQCGLWKLLTEYYQKRPGLLFSWCKVCHSAKAKIHNQNNREQATKRARERYQAEPERARERRREWRAANLEKAREQERAQDARRREQRAEYRKSKAGHIKQRQAEYRERAAEQIKAYNKAYSEANKERLIEKSRRYYDANREHYAELGRQWRAANKDTVNAGTHRRRNRLRGAEGSWTAEEWQALKKHFDYRCLMCGRQEPEIKLTFDHVIPIAQGGSNTIENGQPLCLTCNSSKGAKTLDLRGGL